MSNWLPWLCKKTDWFKKVYCKPWRVSKQGLVYFLHVLKKTDNIIEESAWTKLWVNFKFVKEKDRKLIISVFYWIVILPWWTGRYIQAKTNVDSNATKPLRVEHRGRVNRKKDPKNRLDPKLHPLKTPNPKLTKLPHPINPRRLQNTLPNRIFPIPPPIHAAI